MYDPGTRRSAAVPPRVGLFVPCLVDLIRPRVGFAAIKLVEQPGCVVEVPDAQTGRGRPGFNSGATKTAAALAHQIIIHFEQFDHVVVPSASCAAMIKVHYAEALANDPLWLPRGNALAANREVKPGLAMSA
jgi:L-lactate dehydrogenase complex protein LldE